jgi:hypothetical protein
MPLDIPLPWVHGPNTSEALSSGGSAGAAAARTVASRDEDANRMAMESMQLNQRAAIESAKLSQDEHLAAMEAATRKEIAQQTALRENQKIAIEQAYHQAAIGMAKDRLDQQKMIADAKGREAAIRLQREQQFGAAVASGMSVMDAYRQFPVPPSVVNSFATQERERIKSEKPDVRSGHYPLVKVNPDGTTTNIYTPPPVAPKAGSKSVGSTLMSQLQGGAAPPASTADIPPNIGMRKSPVALLPKSTKDLQEGQTYQTRHGPAVWDGERFNRVTDEETPPDDANRP